MHLVSLWTPKEMIKVVHSNPKGGICKFADTCEATTARLMARSFALVCCYSAYGDTQDDHHEPRHHQHAQCEVRGRIKAVTPKCCDQRMAQTRNSQSKPQEFLIPGLSQAMYYLLEVSAVGCSLRRFVSLPPALPIRLRVAFLFPDCQRPPVSGL